MQEVSPSSTTVERTLMIKSPESHILGNQQSNYGEVCQVCQLTKFTDFAGKSCFLCLNKACSRCGFNVEIQQDSVRTVMPFCFLEIHRPMLPRATICKVAVIYTFYRTSRISASDGIRTRCVISNYPIFQKISPDGKIIHSMSSQDVRNISSTPK